MNSNVSGDWYGSLVPAGRPRSQDHIGRRSRTFRSLCDRIARSAAVASVPRSSRWRRRVDALFANMVDPLHPGEAVSHVRHLLSVRWCGDPLASREVEVGVIARAWLETIVDRAPLVDRSRAAHVAILFEAYLRCEVLALDPWTDGGVLVHVDPTVQRPAHASRHALVVHLEARRLAGVPTPQTAQADREPRQGRPRSARWGWAEALAVLTDAPDELERDDALKRVLASIRAAERNLGELLDRPTGAEAEMAHTLVGPGLSPYVLCP